MENKQRTLGVLLFPGFELLDVFGPLEMFGMLGDLVRLVLISERIGPVVSAQGPEAVASADFATHPRLDLVLVPGGIGTRKEVANQALLEWLLSVAKTAEVVASVCTGAGLLAKAGLLDGCLATTNKRAFAWVAEQGPSVHWVKQARWVAAEGGPVTSSGVSAGIDMSLALIARLYGTDAAEQVARAAEYEWHRDPTWDPFAALYGLHD